MSSYGGLPVGNKSEHQDRVMHRFQTSRHSLSTSDYYLLLASDWRLSPDARTSSCAIDQRQKMQVLIRPLSERSMSIIAQ